jgi:SAM-dependent methyltransferase
MPQGPQVVVDERAEIHEGEAAARRLEAERARQARFFDPAQGVARVDRARWEEAQRYEKHSWLVNSRRQATDRNEYHRAQMAGYDALRGLTFARGIELGCGPFTNMRFILEVCGVREITLLDPLLNDYLRHRFCRYAGGRLGGLWGGGSSLLGLRHPLAYLSDRLNAHRIGGWHGRPVRLAASMIEQYTADAPFDLVVMINVIEHCQDAPAVFAKILELLRPGGVLVFGDRLYDAAQVQALAAHLYDAGHPLRVDRRVINAFLDENFTRLHRSERAVRHVFRGVEQAGDELYYIGRRHDHGD